MHLKCGVSVSKRNDSECAWVEEAEFKDVSDKTFGDFFIAPRLSSSPITLTSCTAGSKIKREFDSNLPGSLNDICHRPARSKKYSKESISTDITTTIDIGSKSGLNQPVQIQPGSQLKQNAISRDKTDDTNILSEFLGQDSVNKKSLIPPTLSEDSDNVLNNVPLFDGDNFEDESEPVLVRPIPTDMEEHREAKRKPSFDGKICRFKKIDSPIQSHLL